MSLYQTLTGLADRHLTPERMAALRTRYLALRTRARPFIRMVNGSFDAAKLRRHLEERIGRDWEVLFVHSSLNGLQPMFDGDALGLVRMLIDFAGQDRTIAMPAFYFGDPAIGGAGRTFEVRPRFDLKREASQMGLPSELFRRSKGVMQSRNPIYRVSALGPLADEMTHGHELADTLCGAGTPFDFMAKRNTLVLGLGKPLDVLTQVHHSEDVLGNAFPVPRNTSPQPPLPMTLVEGGTEIAYRLPRDGLLWKRDMWRVRAIMSPGTLKEWSFHGAPMFAARAGDVSRSISEAARRGKTIYVMP